MSVRGKVDQEWEAGIGILTRTGKEGMGDELGDWPGRFRALNLGTTATLTLRRGMFCRKRRDWIHFLGGNTCHSSEGPGKRLLVPNAVMTLTGYFGLGILMVLNIGVKWVAKVDSNFLLVVRDLSVCSYFRLWNPGETEWKWPPSLWITSWIVC